MDGWLEALDELLGGILRPQIQKAVIRVSSTRWCDQEGQAEIRNSLTLGGRRLLQTEARPDIGECHLHCEIFETACPHCGSTAGFEGGERRRDELLKCIECGERPERPVEYA